jgi:hypothetical protein
MSKPSPGDMSASISTCVGESCKRLGEPSSEVPEIPEIRPGRGTNSALGTAGFAAMTLGEMCVAMGLRVIFECLGYVVFFFLKVHGMLYM